MLLSLYIPSLRLSSLHDTSLQHHIVGAGLLAGQATCSSRHTTSDGSPRLRLVDPLDSYDKFTTSYLSQSLRPYFNTMEAHHPKLASDKTRAVLVCRMPLSRPCRFSRNVSKDSKHVHIHLNTSRHTKFPYFITFP